MRPRSGRGIPHMLTLRLRAVGHQGIALEAFSDVQREEISKAALARDCKDTVSSEFGSRAK